MNTSDFYYELPPELIAQTPVAVRDTSRLLVYGRMNGALSDDCFSNILEYLNEGDVLVRNVTRVIPARLLGKRGDTGGAMEFLLLCRVGDDIWQTIVRPARRAKIGLKYIIGDELSAIVLDSTSDGGRIVQFQYEGIFEEVLDRVGQTPLPPYIVERLEDSERYQTVYARENGSAAAPTAGLHFTKPLLEQVRAKGVVIADILLHVGLGTFRPVSAKTVEEHHMHSEYYEVSVDSANAINNARQKGGRVIAVGTTSCRTLESVADKKGFVAPGSGWTDIFITPGYDFKVVEGLITNFHLPESTLLMLICAFAKREGILEAYKHAVEHRYRFFSFGDAMLIL